MKYSIEGAPLPVVICDLDAGETMITEKGAMSWMTPNMKMETVGGGAGKMIGRMFSGEGFIMQKLSGNGMAFVEIDGHVKEYELAAGQSMVIDTGYLAAMEGTCRIEITSVKGLKNKLLGGEGFFNTVVTGPGKIYLQSMPINQMADVLRPFFPSGS